MLRLAYVLVAFFTMTPAYIAALWLIGTFHLPGRRWLTIRYCRALCGLLRVRIRTIGSPAQGRPALILCNHVSWIDIPVMAAIGPNIFVAKSEVASWPIVGITARLQRTVFVDRARRQDTSDVNAEIAERLNQGEPVVLFAEGTSSDGNRVLEFRSALVGAIAQVSPDHEVLLQPASIGYTRVQGMPMGRRLRPLVAWYGDLDFTPHFKEVVRRGPFDVTVSFGEPVRFDGSLDRKTVARSLETTVRRLTVAALRERAAQQSVAA